MKGSTSILAARSRVLRLQFSESFEIGLPLSSDFYLNYVLTETDVADAVRCHAGPRLAGYGTRSDLPGIAPVSVQTNRHTQSTGWRTGQLRRTSSTVGSPSSFFQSAR